MLLKILGWFWVVTGIFFLMKPESLRNKLRKRSIKTIRRWLFAILLFFGLLLINATWGVTGWLPKVILIVGIIALIKAFFFFKAKSADKVVAWFLEKPVNFFRMCAVGQIVFGAVLLTV